MTINAIHWNSPPFHWDNPIMGVGVRFASGLTVNGTGTTTGDGDALATVTIPANELEAGDTVRISYTYDGTFTANNIIGIGWLTSIAGGNQLYYNTISNGGSDSLSGIRNIYINSATEAVLHSKNSTSGTGPTSAAATSLTIDTTSDMDIVIGYNCAGACDVNLRGYIIEIIKACS